MTRYQKAINYIYDLNKYGMKLGLNNITYLLSLFDNPHLKNKTIHIAGTNGKGSTAAMISTILKSAKYKAGLYTSPHLVNFQERFRINGKMISKKDICDLLERLKPAIQKVAKTEGYQHPTFFEVITTMAFLYFHDQNVDFAVIETGLGGRLDATNVCKPIVSVITNIDYDHMDQLGNTLSAISWEKGSIIKKNTPVLIAQQSLEAENVLVEMANKMNSEFYRVGKEIIYSINKSSIDGSNLNYSGLQNKYISMDIPLRGSYQAENASLAIATAEVLMSTGYFISEKNIRDGLKNTNWPGRFEIVFKEPLTILDGAHNPDGVKKFMEELKRYLPDKKIVAVIGVFMDKDYRNIIKNVIPFVDNVVLTMAQNKRATPTSILAEESEKYIDKNNIFQEISVDLAIKKAFSIAKNEDIICITGSLYTVGEAKEFFIKNYLIK